MSGSRILLGCLGFLLVSVIPAAKPQAAPLGLPFTETFSDTDLQDATRTNANWSTEEQAVLLALRQTRFGAFDPDITSSTEITTDSRATRSIAVGDLDGDGELDLVAADAGQPNRLYLNNGTENPFAGVGGSDITTDASSTFSVALGDMDGDGDLDLVAGNVTERNRLYLNNGTSNPFAGVVGSEITDDASDTFSVAIGDVDGDGDLDLVAGNVLQTNRLYLNNGTADPFGSVVGADISSDVHATDSVALGDMDGDGDLDLVAGNIGQVNRLYLNSGTLDPFNGVAGTDITADVDLTRSVALGDVNGDGHLDLVTAISNDPNRLYLNNGTENPFEGVTGSDITADDLGALSVVLGDIEGDGDLDLVSGNANARNRLYLNNGSPDPFASSLGQDITNDSDNTNEVALGDFDGDGDLDIAAGNFNEPNRLYLNKANANPWNGEVGSDITADASPIQAIASGDMDGDGDLDLVTVNSDEPTRLYRNNGTSDPFGGVMGSDVGSGGIGTRAVTIGDLDRDGDLDVVTGNAGSGIGATNLYYLNNGTSNPFDGATARLVSVAQEADFTTSLALGDLDGDGDLDLVAGNIGTNQSTRLYLNDGSTDPFFGVPGTDLSADGLGARVIALGDLDRDGDMDLVAGKEFEPTRLYLNNGTSDPFAGVTGVEFTPINNPPQVNLTLADMDGNGSLDLTIAGENSPPRVYLNNGTTTPFEGVMGTGVSEDGDMEIGALVAGDVDGDGDADIVVGNGLSQPNRLFLNNGTSEPFNDAPDFTITDDSHDTFAVALGDFDGDGALDFVAGNFNQPHRVYLNNASPKPVVTWRGSDIAADMDDTRSVALGDVDGDGDLDLVEGNAFVGSNRLFLNNGTSEPFRDVLGATITHDASRTGAVALGDLDGDGDLDLVAGRIGERNRLYLNNGTSNPFAGVVGSDISTDEHTTFSVALGDIDRDGDLDVVAGNAGFPAQRNRLYLNNGTADPFAGVAGSDITADEQGTFSVALGDLDNDGDLDIVAANSNQSRRLYLNNGTPDPFAGVGSSIITSETHSTLSMALGDLDNDGDLDIVAGNPGQRNRLFLNNGTSAPFAGVIGRDISLDADNTFTVALGDLDRDGDLDLVAGNFGERNRLYLNNGTADPFAAVAGIDIASDTHDHRALGLGDLDRDGCLDLIAGNAFQPNRFYTRRLFHTAQGRATSLAVDTETADIFEVVLEVTQTLPINTVIDYWLSNNGGAKSYLVTPGELFAFPTAGSDLRWRAELKSLSPLFSPRLETLALQLGRDLVVDPTSVDYLDLPIDAGPSQPVTITLTNRGANDLFFMGFGIVGIDFTEFVVSQNTLGTFLPPGFSGTIDIAFDPSTVGPKSAAFQVSSDDPAAPVVQVALAGVGIEPPTVTPTPTRSDTPTEGPTPTPSNTPMDGAAPTATDTFSGGPTPTPSGTPTEGPSPTPSDTPTEGPSQTPSDTPTFGTSPTPSETLDYDIKPEPPDGVVDALDLIEWIARLRTKMHPRELLFDFSQEWHQGD